MRTVNKPILDLIIVPVASPAIIRVEALPVVAKEFYLAPVKAEATVDKYIEVHRQAAQVEAFQGFAQALIQEALLFFSGTPGVPESEAEAHNLGILYQLGDVQAEELLFFT